MKTTKIKIKNLFGIAETELDGNSVEITGTNGVGKTSVIDAVKYALTNCSDRKYTIKKGETEGEILIETDAGIYINRKKREQQADYKSIKENGKDVTAPEQFLKQLFTPLQLNPVEFSLMPEKEQNRIILDLIDFKWDLNWIKEKFGEIPEDVDYSQNILQVLNDIQSEKGQYFTERQDLNRDIRNKRAFVEEIAACIPNDYQAEKWDSYDLSEAYSKLEKMRSENNKIERAKAFRENYDNKLRSLEADRDIAEVSAERAVQVEKENLLADIEKLKERIKSDEEKINSLSETLKMKTDLAESKYNEGKAKLDGDIRIADEFCEKEKQDTSLLEAEAKEAEAMKKLINEYNRMVDMQEDIERISDKAQELTHKIELARNLPGEILKTATIPIDGFTVENGVPLINGLPVSNLSEGEKLELCVDVTISKPNALQIILIDGVEKLSDENRLKLYNKCKEKGLQFIATRTTNNNEMEINYL